MTVVTIVTNGDITAQTALSDDPDLAREVQEHDSVVPEKIMNPGSVDEPKWKAAKADVMKEYGEIRWPVVSYVYRKMGGTFHRKEQS
jgi:hypothetical protein